MPPAIKIILVGDTGVGKTSIANRAADNRFIADSSPTVGASTFGFDVDTATGPVTIKLWDTAGQETFRSLIPLYFQSASVVILVFDLTRADTFESLPEWVALVKKNAPSGVTLVLVGNKSDLESSRAISFDHATEFANSINAAAYKETSAATGQSVAELFQDLAGIDDIKREGEGVKLSLHVEQEQPRQNQCC